MKTCTIALAQIDLALGDPERNWQTARAAIAQARDRGADLIVLPELWGSAGDLEHVQRHATPLDAGMFARVRDAAREFHIAITGSLLESDGDHIYNTATLVDARGEQMGAYRKLHLIPLFEEDRYLTGGQDAPVLETSWGQCALAICYDLRFPEQWRHYALSGVQLVLVPAEWPVQRIAHWRTLLPARAIENQFYVAATNRVGVTNGETFGGHSMIVDPWGDILVEGDEKESLLVAQIDLDSVQQVRERVPVFKGRREDVYSKWRSL